MREDKLRRLDMKSRAYQILSINFSASYLLNTLKQEFDEVKDKVVYEMVNEIKKEIKKDYEERLPLLKENLLNSLFHIALTANNNFEKIKAIETIIKLTGISEEVIRTETTSKETKYILDIRSDDTKTIEI